MKTGTVVLLVFVSLLLIGGMGACGVITLAVGTYNNLNALNQDVNEKWSQVQNVYQRRNDLIPNLVETVKGYAQHEMNTIVGTIAERAKATQTQISINPADLNAKNLAAFQKAQGEISSMLSRLMVVMERYPNLKADQHFVGLMSQIEGSENRIAVERNRYNKTARDYNTKLLSFPTTLFVSFLPGQFPFKEKPYFEAEKGAEKAPKVDFGTTKK